MIARINILPIKKLSHLEIHPYVSTCAAMDRNFTDREILYNNWVAKSKAEIV